MKNTLPIALAQVNSTVGDLQRNRDVLVKATRSALKKGARLIVFPELFLTGYPPEDLVLKIGLQEQNRAVVGQIAERFRGEPISIILPTIWKAGGKLYNAALVIAGGGITGKFFKHELPNYGVFDEKRVFQPGALPRVATVEGVGLGVMICEDMWFPKLARHYKKQGAELLIVVNGSPYHMQKDTERHQLAAQRVQETRLPLVYVNTVGGQDELVFDGGSFAMNADGEIAHHLPEWEEQVAVTAWERGRGEWRCLPGRKARPPSRLEAVYLALMTGLRDYIGKNGFPGVVLGLSGGIDSALSAAIAADAIGPANVRCIMMPSRFTSAESLEDAAQCAGQLGANLERISIEGAMEAYDATLRAAFRGLARDVTEENIQARIRGQILMAISNKFGLMVLSTGNKSELAVGYSTLYGDLCGGYSVLKDVYKTLVYQLAVWRNAHRPKSAKGPKGPVIPENILTKAPTAELRENQKDEDSLPPYAVLDDILNALVEEDEGSEQIIGRGHAPETVHKVQQLLYNAEYKRRQAPPGVKVSTKLFGRERRYPITNRYRDDI